ncbi:Uncharacterised protein [Salmonella enterica subsp. enterica serovar Typhi]|nr:Uncharacterised protein [Salmonella enterica subsp. enterica serovar Typhi]CGZ27865.1 Uncharacterised protein [Salmonella enterica subsp. enterica serovar Typhi]CHC98086.1 Uncharacterised protein [Salmonella enterica subsp. enterica serovar Typhi]
MSVFCPWDFSVPVRSLSFSSRNVFCFSRASFVSCFAAFTAFDIWSPTDEFSPLSLLFSEMSALFCSSSTAWRARTSRNAPISVRSVSADVSPSIPSAFKSSWLNSVNALVVLAGSGSVVSFKPQALTPIKQTTTINTGSKTFIRPLALICMLFPFFYCRQYCRFSNKGILRAPSDHKIKSCCIFRRTSRPKPTMLESRTDKRS